MRFDPETKVTLGVEATLAQPIWYAVQSVVAGLGGTASIREIANECPRRTDLDFGRSAYVRDGKWLAFANGYVREALAPCKAYTRPYLKLA